VTTIYVTHDQVEAMTMGHRVAVLKDGRLQQVDTPRRLYDHPTNVFVAAFIGSPSMNLHEASVDGTSLRLGTQSLDLDTAVFDRVPDLRAYDGRAVVVGIRPEDLEDATMSSTATDGRRLSAHVTLREALGAEVLVHMSIDAPRVDAGDPDAAESVRADGRSNMIGRFDPRSTVAIGEVAEVAVNVENLHFFDPDTRLSLRRSD
jgi:multiple sugar transport system ATP-binding protein